MEIMTLTRPQEGARGAKGDGRVVVIDRLWVILIRFINGGGKVIWV